MKDLLQLTSTTRLLDVGCGPLARAEVYFGRQGFHVVGVDVSVTATHHAHRLVQAFQVADQVDLVVADAEYLPLRDRSVDRILAAGLLVHLPSKTSVRNTLRQFAQCLTAQGLCYLIWLPNLYSFLGPFFSLVTRLGFLGQSNRIQLLTFQGVAELRTLCHQAGFTVAQVIHNSALWIGFYLLPSLFHRAIDRMMRARARSPRPSTSPPFAPYAFNILATKSSHL